MKGQNKTRRGGYESGLHPSLRAQEMRLKEAATHLESRPINKLRHRSLVVSLA